MFRKLTEFITNCIKYLTMSANLCQIKSGISKFEKKNSFQIQQYLKKKKTKKKNSFQIQQYPRQKNSKSFIKIVKDFFLYELEKPDNLVASALITNSRV